MNRKLWLRVSNVFSFSLVLFQLSTISGTFIKRQSEINEVCESEGCVAAAKQLNISIDTTVEPCDDFYQYACGNWPKNYCKTKECDFSLNFLLRGEQNSKEIIEFLSQENNKDEPEALHKARKLYSMCLNPTSYKGLDRVKNMLSELGLPILPLKALQKEKTSASSKSDSNSTFDYVRAMAKMTRKLGIQAFFSVGVSVNPYNLDENLIAVSQPDISQSLLSMNWNTHYVEQIMKTLCEDEKLSDDEISCNFNLTNNQLVNTVTSRDSNLNTQKKSSALSSILVLYTLDELQKMSDDIADEVKTSLPKFNFSSYIEELFSGIENTTLDLRNASDVQVVVREKYIRFAIKFLYEFNIQELEFELWWQVVSQFLRFTDWEIFEAAIIEASLLPLPRDKACAEYIVLPNFSHAISYMYLKKDSIKHANQEIEEMIDYMRDDLRTELELAAWIDEETKEKALKKLSLMKLFTGNHDLKEFQRLLGEENEDAVITDSIVDFMIQITQKKVDKNLNKLNEPVDLTFDWSAMLTTVNAFYTPNYNSIVIPSAILDWPIYIQSLKAFTYGSLGLVVGHELIHGFDNQGRKYNEFGAIEDWWKNDTSIKFTERAECFKEVYSKYETKFNGVFQKINSTLSLGEDIADNGGFKRALNAYKSYVCENGEEPALIGYENFTHEQIFTLGFANIWCEYPTQKIADVLAKIDTHTPDPVRVNGVLKNSKEFAEIWNCPKGSQMNPDKKCSLW